MPNAAINPDPTASAISGFTDRAPELLFLFLDNRMHYFALPEQFHKYRDTFPEQFEGKTVEVMNYEQYQHYVNKTMKP